MPNNLKSQFDKQGFLVVRNVLDFNFDLKPVLNDMEFIMNRLIDRFVSKNNKSINQPIHNKFHIIKHRF